MDFHGAPSCFPMLRVVHGVRENYHLLPKSCNAVVETGHRSALISLGYGPGNTTG